MNKNQCKMNNGEMWDNTDVKKWGQTDEKKPILRYCGNLFVKVYILRK